MCIRLVVKKSEEKKENQFILFYFYVACVVSDNLNSILCRVCLRFKLERTLNEKFSCFIFCMCKVELKLINL